MSNTVTVLFDTAKCEFCHYIGIRESFFSKSKRFCKMECAKRYSSASNIKQKAKGDKIGTPKKKHRTSDRHHKVSLKLDLLSNLVTVLSDTAKCEFCCYIGVREHFFSKSKRFCKMECTNAAAAAAAAASATSSASTAAAASGVQEVSQDGQQVRQHFHKPMNPSNSHESSNGHFSLQ